jgi:hypothetical protein
MHDAIVIEGNRQKFLDLDSVMDERMRRQWAAAEAKLIGWGGTTALATATGMSRTTIAVGIKELRGREAGGEAPTARVGSARDGGEAMQEVFSPEGLEHSLHHFAAHRKQPQMPIQQRDD